MRSLLGFQGDIWSSTCSTEVARSWHKAFTSKAASASTLADQRVPMVGPCKVMRLQGAADAEGLEGLEDIFGITLFSFKLRYAQLHWCEHRVQRLGHALRHGPATADTHDSTLRYQVA